MKIDDIKIDPSGGEVIVSVTAVKYPQSIAGIIWRYKPDQSPDGKSGEFTTKIPNVPLGVPLSILGKFFLIEGAVLHQNDNPPTPYQVVVTVEQDSKVVGTTVPEEGGSGQIGESDQAFYYQFRSIQ